MKVYTLLFVIFSSTYLTVKAELKLGISNKENMKIFANINDVIFATSSTFEGHEFLFDIPNPSFVVNFKENHHQVYKSFYQNYNYVITEENYTDSENTILSLHQDDNLKVNGKYLLIINLVQKHELKKYFQLLWSYEIYNVILHINSTFFTWYPYEKSGDMVVRKTTLLEGFLNKIPKRLNCPLKISWNHCRDNLRSPFNRTNPGGFVLHVDVLTKAMGSQSVYLPNVEDLNKMVLNKTFDVSRHMKKNNITLAIGSLPAMFRRGFEITFDDTHFVQETVFLLVLPLKRVKPKWKEFIKCDTITLVLIPTTLIICGMLISTKSKMSLGASIFLSWQIFIQLNTSIDPRKVKVRVFLVLMLFSMLINFFYLNELSSVFTKPNYEGRIRSVRDFAMSDIPLDTHKPVLKFLGQYQDQETKNLLRKKFTESKGRTQIDYVKRFVDGNIAQVPVAIGFIPYVRNPEVIEKFQVLLVLTDSLYCTDLFFFRLVRSIIIFRFLCAVTLRKKSTFI